MDVSGLTGGGAPILGEPAPIDLANTTYAVRRRMMDGLRTPEHLAAWLRDTRARLTVDLTDDDLATVTDHDLAVARELREAIRTLAAAAVDQQPLDRDAASTLNQQARRSPRWYELEVDPEPHAVVRHADRPVAAALAALADEAVGIFGGPRRYDVRACQGPGCVLFFVRDDPRREWCSAGCGNRARAARHYAKARQRG